MAARATLSVRFSRYRPTTAHRRVTGVLTVAAMASALSVTYAPAARAQSHTCPECGARTIELNDGSASATIAWF